MFRLGELLKSHIAAASPPHTEMPAENLSVTVIGHGFRCAGYLAKGIWWNYYTKEELKGVMAWTE
jgi:hypothetical protein